MEVKLDISITDIEPTRSYIEEMDTICAYLKTKDKPSILEQKMIRAQEYLHESLDKLETNGEQNPFTIIEGGKT